MSERDGPKVLHQAKSMNISKTADHRVCFPFVGDSVGGSHLSALLLIKHLRPPFLPLVVVHERGPLTDHLDDIGVEYRMLPLPTYVGASRRKLDHATAIIQTAPLLWRFLRREGASIVHAHDNRMNLTWALPTRISGGRFVWHQRTQWAQSQLIDLMVKLADYVVCISQFCAADMHRRSTNAFCVLQNPFDTSSEVPSKPVARSNYFAETRTPANARIVGFVGNLTRQKRPFVFLEAAKLIKQASPVPVSFAMLGADRDGLAAKIRQRARELDLDDDLHIMGFRYPINDWIAACHVLLSPEVNDAFGRTLVEAMLVKTPVVASDSGGHREIVDHGRTGFLVPPDEHEEMARAASMMLEHPERGHEITRVAREEALKRYSAVVHAERVMSLYGDILRGRGAQAANA
jgi:glycosyltransferase involved in cell wall biosynthesis